MVMLIAWEVFLIKERGILFMKKRYVFLLSSLSLKIKRIVKLR